MEGGDREEVGKGDVDGSYGGVGKGDMEGEIERRQGREIWSGVGK